MHIVDELQYMWQVRWGLFHEWIKCLKIKFCKHTAVLTWKTKIKLNPNVAHATIVQILRPAQMCDWIGSPETKLEHKEYLQNFMPISWFYFFPKHSCQNSLMTDFLIRIVGVRIACLRVLWIWRLFLFHKELMIYLYDLILVLICTKWSQQNDSINT